MYLWHSGNPNSKEIRERKLRRRKFYTALEATCDHHLPLGCSFHGVRKEDTWPEGLKLYSSLFCCRVGSQGVPASLHVDEHRLQTNNEVAFPFCFLTAVLGLPFFLFTQGILCFNLQLQDSKDIILDQPSSLPVCS